MDKLVINALFEIVTSESKNGPLILFMKDVEFDVPRFYGRNLSFKDNSN